MTTTKDTRRTSAGPVTIAGVVVATLLMVALWAGMAVYLPPMRAYLNPDTPRNSHLFPDFINIISVVLVFGLGALIVLRSTNRPYGWLMIAILLTTSISSFSGIYSRYALLVVPEADLPLGLFAGWLQDIYMPIFMLFYSLIFLFPNGRLPSPKWRPIYGIVLVIWTLLALVWAFIHRELGNNFENAPIDIANPYGFLPPSPIWPIVINGLFVVGFMLSTVAGIGSLAARWRRESVDVRQQIKWMLYVFILTLVLFLLSFLNNILLVQLAGIDLGIDQFLGAITQFELLVIGVTLGLAVLRYRLYDIDLIIRRTLTYTVLTVFLLLVYGGSIIVLQRIFRTITGQDSALAIVISTLSIAALFAPLCRRIQDFIDRRFYRRHYDAQEILDSLSASMRDEVDVDKLQDALLNAVTDTMQPEHASLWIRERKS